MRFNKRKATYLAAGTGAGMALGTIAAAVAARAAWRRLRMSNIRGQVVLITGGSRGLGLAMAREFARQGCRIAICARDEQELERARGDLEARGATVLTCRCDVGDPAQVREMIDTAARHYGRIDILVNNAGVIQVGPVESLTLDDFETAMRVMFWGVLYPTMAVLPAMLDRGSGRIVNITSIGGKVAVPHLLPYACAKFAAVGLSEGLRAEVKSKGVRVVTIAPGLMRTGSYLNAWFKGSAVQESEWFSVSSSVPGLTMSAERAARQIVRATRRGTAEKILTAQASLLARFHGLFPGLTADILGLVNRLILPAGHDRRQVRGSEVQELNSRFFAAMTVMGRQAARRHLQPQVEGEVAEVR